jgi:hypothetical protein
MSFIGAVGHERFEHFWTTEDPRTLFRTEEEARAHEADIEAARSMGDLRASEEPPPPAEHDPLRRRVINWVKGQYDLYASGRPSAFQQMRYYTEFKNAVGVETSQLRPVINEAVRLVAEERGVDAMPSIVFPGRPAQGAE